MQHLLKTCRTVHKLLRVISIILFKYKCFPQADTTEMHLHIKPSYVHFFYITKCGYEVLSFRFNKQL